jgi:hypothetical protein
MVGEAGSGDGRVSKTRYGSCFPPQDDLHGGHGWENREYAIVKTAEEPTAGG